jgi:hypothetical protein
MELVVEVILQEALRVMAEAEAVAVEIAEMLLLEVLVEMDMKLIILQVGVAEVLALLVTEFMEEVTADRVGFMAEAAVKVRLLQAMRDQEVLVVKELYVLFGNIIFYGTFCIN